MSTPNPLKPNPRPAEHHRSPFSGPAGLIAGLITGLILTFPLVSLGEDAPSDNGGGAEQSSPSEESATSKQDAAPEQSAEPDEAGPAQEATAPDEPGRLGVELNRLEQLDGSCRVYLVFQNGLGTPLEALQLELVLFDDQGFIQRRLTLDAAPIAADKTSVKLFDLADTQCDEMGRILVNDLLELAGPEGELPNEVSQLELSTKLEVELFK
jgi:hypothetical protein